MVNGFGKEKREVRNQYKEHTTETDATRSYIIIPASAKARLAHDITTGRSPSTKRVKEI